MIFVVSEPEGHISFLKENFKVDDEKIINLDIPDMYYTHDPKLKELLIEKKNNKLILDMKKYQ